MNKHQFNGTIKALVGKAQAHMGRLMGSRSQQARGLAMESQGRLQKSYGNVKAALQGSRHS